MIKVTSNISSLGATPYVDAFTTGEIIGLILIPSIAVTFLYFLIGLGVARMAAKIKEREIWFPDLALWPVMCVIFAIFGDVAN